MMNTKVIDSIRMSERKDRILAATFQIALAVFALMAVNPSHAGLFNLEYRDAAGSLLGTGVFGYQQPAQVGIFAFRELDGGSRPVLRNVHFSASFAGGESFDQDDIVALSRYGGISVFVREDQRLGMVFTGWADDDEPFNGPFDLQNDRGLLTHEPTIGIWSREGCCGGDGTANLFMLNESSGSYIAISVNEPGAVGLLLFALLATISFRSGVLRKIT